MRLRLLKKREDFMHFNSFGLFDKNITEKVFRTPEILHLNVSYKLLAEKDSKTIA